MVAIKSQKVRGENFFACLVVLFALVLAGLASIVKAGDPPATRPAEETDVHELRATIFNEAAMIGILRGRVEELKKQLAAAHGQTVPEPDVTLTVKPYADLPADSGWEFKKVAYRYSGINPHIEASVTNHSGKSCGVAIFEVSVFDKDEKFVGMMMVAIANFDDGKTKKLSAPMIDVPFERAATVKIKFIGAAN